jgi:hypothetical protein
MTEETRANTRITGTLRSVDGRGVVRMEGTYDTGIDDLWSALTDAPGSLDRRGRGRPTSRWRVPSDLHERMGRSRPS